MGWRTGLELLLSRLSFAQWLSEDLQGMIERERQRAEEGLALRKYRYDAGKGEC